MQRFAAWVVIGLVAALFLSGVGVVNIFDFKTAYQYGLQVYFNNIITFQIENEYVAKKSLPIYSSMDVNSLKENSIGLSIPEGRTFRDRGYIEEDHITWAAIEIYNGPKLVTGFILLEDGWKLEEEVGNTPKQNPYVKYAPTFNWEESIAGVFKNRLMRELNLQVTSNSLQQQKLKGDSSVHIIESISTKKTTYYVPISEKDKVSKIYDDYFGYALDAHFLQIKSSYNVKRDGAYKPTGELTMISSKWTKFGLAALLILAFANDRRRRQA